MPVAATTHLARSGCGPVWRIALPPSIRAKPLKSLAFVFHLGLPPTKRPANLGGLGAFVRRCVSTPHLIFQPCHHRHAQSTEFPTDHPSGTGSTSCARSRATIMCMAARRFLRRHDAGRGSGPGTRSARSTGRKGSVLGYLNLTRTVAQLEAPRPSSLVDRVYESEHG